MPAYNFKKEFTKAVENGLAEAEGLPLPWPGEPVKRQTIRKRRKRPTVADDSLYLFTGMRTHRCRRLGEATCKSVTPIRIMPTGVILDGAWLNDYRLKSLVSSDGFGHPSGFFNFFEKQYGLPVELELIKW